MEPQFKKGDMVTRGKTGTIPHEVMAVITTGRVVTYDLRSMGSLSGGRLFIGVPESKLKEY